MIRIAMFSLCIIMIFGCASTATEQANPAQPPVEEEKKMEIVPPKSAADMTPTHRVTSQTPYYETGPQQGRPPEGSFDKDTQVVLLGDSTGSYVIVESKDGRKGWIPKDALELISP